MLEYNFLIDDIGWGILLGGTIAVIIIIISERVK